MDSNFFRWHFQNRMLVALLAVILLWLTSWRMVSFVVSFSISAPPFEVAGTCRNSVKILLDEEGRKYSNCVSAQLRQCRWNLQLSEMTGQLRVHTTSDDNRAILREAREAQTQCVSAVRSIDAAQVYGSKSDSPTSQGESGVCMDHQHVRNSVRSDAQDLRVDALSAFSDYIAMSQRTVQELSEFSIARVRYDHEFFVKNGTGSINRYLESLEIPSSDFLHPFQKLIAESENLVSCVSIRKNTNHTCPYSSGARILLQSSLVEPLTEALDYLATNIERFGGSIDSLVDELDKRTRILEDILRGAHLIAYEANIPPQALPDILTLDLSFPASDSYKPTPFEVNLQFSVASVDAVWEKVSNAQRRFSDALYQTRSQLIDSFVNTTDRVVADLRSVLNPQNYNPPGFSVSTDFREGATSERERHAVNSQRVDGTLSMIRNEILSSTRFGGNFFDTETQWDNFDRSLPGLPNPNHVMSPRPSLLTPRWPVYSLSTDTLAKTFQFMIDNFFLFEVTYQIWWSVKFFCKYWHASAVEIPTVDRRRYVGGQNQPRAFWYIPYIRWVVVVVLCSMVSSIYWSYLREEYVAGCVLSNGGTSIASDFFVQIAYNSAVKEGNDLLTRSLAQLQSDNSDTCYALFSASSLSLNEDKFVLANIKKSINDAASRLELLENCLHSNRTMEKRHSWSKASFTEFDTFVRDRGWERLGSDLCPSEVRDSHWQLVANVFDCETLPLCTITCGSGTNDNRIGLLVKESECIMEWAAIHSVFVRVFLVAMIYTALCVSRHMVINGLKKVFWNYLRPKEVEYLVTKQFRSGTLQSGRHDIEIGEMGAECEIQQSAMRLECFGWENLMVAMTVTEAWLCILLLVSETQHSDFLMWPSPWLS